MWTAWSAGEVFGSPLLHDGTLFVATGEGELFAFDARGKGSLEPLIDARPLFENETTASPAAYASLTLAGRYLFLVSRSGETVVLEATREARLVSRNKLPEGTGSSPVFSGKDMFLRDGAKLWCIGGSDALPPGLAELHFDVVEVDDSGGVMRPDPHLQRLGGRGDIHPAVEAVPGVSILVVKSSLATSSPRASFSAECDAGILVPRHRPRHDPLFARILNEISTDLAFAGRNLLGGHEIGALDRRDPAEAQKFIGSFQTITASVTGTSVWFAQSGGAARPCLSEKSPLAIMLRCLAPHLPPRRSAITLRFFSSATASLRSVVLALTAPASRPASAWRYLSADRAAGVLRCGRHLPQP